MSHRRLFARALLLGVFVALRTGSASEARASITVGEISAPSLEEDVSTLDLFRFLVEKEIGRLELDRAAKPTSYVFSASLVRLDAHASRDGSMAVCIVSGALRRASSGTIVAVMRGTSSVDGDRGALPGTKARALEVAVHGAVRHVPEAI